MAEPVTYDPRANVLAVLESRRDAFMAKEERVHRTDTELAADFHRFALLVEMARFVEETDPEPPEPVADCLTCAIAMRRGVQ